MSLQTSKVELLVLLLSVKIDIDIGTFSVVQFVNYNMVVAGDRSRNVSVKQIQLIGYLCGSVCLAARLKGPQTGPVFVRY